MEENKMTKKKSLRCKKCGYIWTPRKEKVKCCPYCKSYLYDEENKI